MSAEAWLSRTDYKLWRPCQRHSLRRPLPPFVLSLDCTAAPRKLVAIKRTVRFIEKSFYAVVIFRLPAYSRWILTILLKFCSFKDPAPGPWEVAPTTRRLSEVRGSASAFYRPAQTPQQVVMLYQVTVSKSGYIASKGQTPLMTHLYCSLTAQPSRT